MTEKLPVTDINIDFQGGMHGNFLEYVCNRFICGIKVKKKLPFNNFGASHSKIYLSPKIFKCGHFSYDPSPLTGDRIVTIKIVPNDLLALQCISFLRAGDHNIAPDKLEINTFNKLNNRDYQWVLDNLIENYFKNQVIDSYGAVKDESWPMIQTIEDYKNLPAHIKQECESQHKLKLFELSQQNPDCPRYILREFFKLGFLDPEISGFMVQQKKAIYPKSADIYNFDFNCFYDTKKFQTEINKIAAWANYYPDYDLLEFESLHQEFLSRQPFKDVKIKCDSIVNQIENLKSIDLTNLNVIEEAYIEAQLEKNNNVKIDPRIEYWAHTSDDLIPLLQSKNSKP